MMILDDSQVCKECAAFSAGNGYCASLPAHPFEPVTIAEYAALHPDDKAAADYLRTHNEEARLSGEWKQVLGMPAMARYVPRPDADEGTDPEMLEYGGGHSFDQVYTTALVDWVFESRNVGRHDGHMANLRVTRNETGLPWVDGWTEADEALEALMSAAMTELDKQLRPARAPAAGAANDAPVLDASTAFDPTDPFSE